MIELYARRTIVVVSNEVLPSDDRVGISPASSQRADAIERWAANAGHRLRVLPATHTRTHPRADAVERRRLARREEVILLETFRDLHKQIDEGWRLGAFVVTQEELAGQAGRAWYGRVSRAAEEAGIELPRAVRLQQGSTALERLNALSRAW